MKLNSHKFLAFICFGMFCNSNIFGQNLHNDSFNVAIELEANNILYIGLDNPVTIAVSGYPADKIVAKISEGTITKKGNGFSVKVNTWGEVNISIFALENDSNLKFLTTKKYRTRELPFSNTHDIIPKKEHFICLDFIQKYPEKLFPRLKDTFVFSGNNYIVTEFTFTIIDNESKIKSSVKVIGNILNDECKKLLMDVEKDYKIVIDDIKAFGNEKKVTLIPFVIMVL